MIKTTGKIITNCLYLMTMGALWTVLIIFPLIFILDFMAKYKVGNESLMSWAILIFIVFLIAEFSIFSEEEERKRIARAFKRKS